MYQHRFFFFNYYRFFRHNIKLNLHIFIGALRWHRNSAFKLFFSETWKSCGVQIFCIWHDFQCMYTSVHMMRLRSAHLSWCWPCLGCGRVGSAAEGWPRWLAVRIHRSVNHPAFVFWSPGPQPPNVREQGEVLLEYDLTTWCKLTIILKVSWHKQRVVITDHVVSKSRRVLENAILK